MSAIEIISEHGLEKLTIKRLAHEMGFSEPALYRHFRNKMSVLNGILDLFYDETMKMHEEINERGLSPCDCVRSFLMDHIKLVSTNKTYATVIFSEEFFKKKAFLSNVITEIIDKNKAFLSKSIIKGQKLSEIRSDIPPDHLALIILGSIRLLIKKWYNDNFSFDLERESGNLINSLILILLKNKSKK